MPIAEPVAKDAALPDPPAADRMAEAEALLAELESASRLMAEIAAAKGVLPAQYRLKADQMGRNMRTLCKAGRRQIGAAPDPTEG